MKEKWKHTTVNLCWLFVLGSVAGFFMEGFWCMARTGVWERHAATVIGPFCVIYGVGAVAVYIVSNRIQKRNILVQWMVFALCGAGIEYAASLFQETVYGVATWNYSRHILNMGGRISLDMALLFGSICLAFSRLLLPGLRRLFHRADGRFWRCAGILLTMLIVADLLLSTVAITRWKNRANEVVASNALERMMDQVYDDDAMSSLFPNMRFVENQK